MSTFKASIFIERPAAPVFEFLSSVENRPKWQEPLLRVRKKTAGPDGPGTEWVDTVRVAGRQLDFQMAYTEYERDRRFVESARSSFQEATIAVDFEEEPGGTRVTMHGEMRFHGLLKPLGPVLTKGFGFAVQKDLRRIKAMIESERDRERER